MDKNKSVKRYALKLQVQKSCTSEHFSHYRVEEHIITATNDFMAFGRVHETIIMTKGLRSVITVDFLSFQKLIGGQNEV